MIMDEQMAVFKEIDGFICPAEFWPALGYEGLARYIAIWWEQWGDEASWSDGRLSVVGADWLAYRALLYRNLRQGHTAYWLLGSSETSATFHLVIDRESERAWLVPVEDAWQLLGQQWDKSAVVPDLLFEILETAAEDEAVVGHITATSMLIDWNEIERKVVRYEAFIAALDARPK